MKRRVFVAIGLAEHVRNRLQDEVEKLIPRFNPRVSFVKPENWHVTISFLGDQDEASIGLMIGALQEVARESAPPTITFEKIQYGPPRKPPRMLWLLGDRSTSEALGKIKEKLEDRLAEAGVRFQEENRPFTAHLTLARFDGQTTPFPPIEGPLQLTYEAEGLDLMESSLGRGGVEYSSLSLFDFSP